MFSVNILTLSILLLSFIRASSAWSWGERGHNIITQLACKLLKERYEGKDALTKPFEIRCEMLGYLSNIPDIYWRNLPQKDTKGADSSHYIDLDYYHHAPTLKNFSTDIGEHLRIARKNCEVVEKRNDCQKVSTQEIMDKIGTIPWRTNQLADLLRSKFTELANLEQRFAKKNSVSSPADIEKLANEALVYAGLLSHYIGDAAQPLHNTKNYDGFESGQGGIHAYFETIVLGSYDFAILQEAYEYALKNKPAEKLIQNLLKQTNSTLDTWQPVKWSMSLCLDSFSFVDDVLSVDKQYAVRKPSQIQPSKTHAERLAPRDLRVPFKKLMVNRLASGADLLAFFWYQAWNQGGRPNMKNFKSYKYMFTPAYIPVDYVPPKIPAEKAELTPSK